MRKIWKFGVVCAVAFTMAGGPARAAENARIDQNVAVQAKAVPVAPYPEYKHDQAWIYCMKQVMPMALDGKPAHVMNQSDFDFTPEKQMKLRKCMLAQGFPLKDDPSDGFGGLGASCGSVGGGGNRLADALKSPSVAACARP